MSNFACKITKKIAYMQIKMQKEKKYVRALAYVKKFL